MNYLFKKERLFIFLVQKISHFLWIKFRILHTIRHLCLYFTKLEKNNQRVLYVGSNFRHFIQTLIISSKYPLMFSEKGSNLFYIWHHIMWACSKNHYLSHLFSGLRVILLHLKHYRFKIWGCKKPKIERQLTFENCF